MPVFTIKINIPKITINIQFATKSCPKFSIDDSWYGKFKIVKS